MRIHLPSLGFIASILIGLGCFYTQLQVTPSWARPRKDAPSFRLQTLGTLPRLKGHSAKNPYLPISVASGINNKGQVVGSILTEDANGPGETTSHAFIWSRGVVRRVRIRGNHQGTPFMDDPSAINNKGEVVGDWRPKDDSQLYVFYSTRSGGQPLGVLGEQQGRATAVNDRSQIVGWVETKDERLIAFSWHKSRLQTFAWPDDRGSIAYGINNKGQVVGVSSPQGFLALLSPGSRAFLWQNGKLVRVNGLPGGTGSEARDINDTGQIVGQTLFAVPKRRGDSQYRQRAWLYQRGKVFPLPTFQDGRDLDYMAESINNKGEIIGRAFKYDITSRPVLWKNGHIYDLNDVVVNKGNWDIEEVAGINDRGQMVVTGDLYGKGRVLLLSPVR